MACWHRHGLHEETVLLGVGFNVLEAHARPSASDRHSLCLWNSQLLLPHLAACHHALHQQISQYFRRNGHNTLSRRI